MQIFRRVFALLILLGSLAVIASAKCNEPNSPLGFLNRFDAPMANSSKIPLILIHGIHGTGPNASVSLVQTGAGREYWNEFLEKVWNTDKDLREKYDLYIYKYCSDRESVLRISTVLGNEIEKKLSGRPHVIVAHSMGGLVAKSYMANYRFTTGTSKGKKGGELVSRLITLATPHHGTPGANSYKTIGPYTKLGWENAVQYAQKFYWAEFNDGRSCRIDVDSTCPNRSDLRWSNFDGSFDRQYEPNDENLLIAGLNREFPEFDDKLIVYAGYLKPAAWSRTKASSLIIRRNMPNARKLEIANDIIVNGFDRRFGETDGMVPYKSGLNCSPSAFMTSMPGGEICLEKNLARRFIPGRGSTATIGLSTNSSMTISNVARGYDHEDLYTHRDVLATILFDLCETITKCAEPRSTENAASTSSGTARTNPRIASMPTMFLLDVSGSMNDDDKIGQARAAGISAVREMKKNRQAGVTGIRVAVTLFGGECGTAGVRGILPYTTDLDAAESTFNSRIPRPDGLTPLYSAIGESVKRMQAYLVNSSLPATEGRIIVLSDGEDTCGGQIRPQGVYSRANRNEFRNVRLMTIGFGVPAGSKIERDLQYLASVSDGTYFPADNSKQLSRAFEKTIRIYLPKTRQSVNADFERGVRAIIDEDFASALRIWTIYVRAYPNDALGLYNLALTCEALQMYRSAAEKYQEYLSKDLSTPDRRAIEAKIRDMWEEYVAQLRYHVRLIASDRAYLKAFWQSIFNRTSFDLAVEFDSFVFEKRDFYANLPRTLEIEAGWLAKDAQDIAASIDTVARRRTLATFDRDALSLLTLPIGQMDDLIERLNKQIDSLSQLH